MEIVALSLLKDRARKEHMVYDKNNNGQHYDHLSINCLSF
jgi:hypothetical protein